MSSAQNSDRDDGPPPALADRLGYLLKHAQQSYFQLNTTALAPLGISGRECAVLIVIDELAPVSQQAAAARLGIDRTTMVALTDELERKKLLARRQDADDRRKNLVALTAKGRTVLARAVKATREAEAGYLSVLSRAEAVAFRSALRALVLTPRD